VDEASTAHGPDRRSEVADPERVPTPRPAAGVPAVLMAADGNAAETGTTPNPTDVSASLDYPFELLSMSCATTFLSLDPLTKFK